MHESGRRAACCRSQLIPALAFLRNYLVHGGIRDGVPGFIISALNSYYVLLKFAKLWELGDAAPVHHEDTKNTEQPL